MNRQSVQEWLDKYVEAWRTYEPAQIRLFRGRWFLRPEGPVGAILMLLT